MRRRERDKSSVDTKTGRESGMWNERTRGWWKGRAREYSRRAYRYATPSAINISGGKKKKKKKDGRTWAGSKGTVAKVLSLAFTMKRRKGSPSFLFFFFFFFFFFVFVVLLLPSSLSLPFSLSLFLPSTPLFPYIPLLDSPPTSKFTLYRRSTKPLGPFRALLKIEDAICLAGLRRRPTCSK